MIANNAWIALGVISTTGRLPLILGRNLLY